MKRSLATIASAAALALVMLVPSRASAHVSIYVGPGYPAYGYRYYRPYYGYYRPYYGYGYRRPYYGYARRHWRRHWRRWH
jgi:hypothetical protein